MPVRVAINEAVELARLFGTEASVRFVNGVLGAVVRQVVPDEASLPVGGIPTEAWASEGGVEQVDAADLGEGLMDEDAGDVAGSGSPAQS